MDNGYLKYKTKVIYHEEHEALEVKSGEKFYHEGHEVLEEKYKTSRFQLTYAWLPVAIRVHLCPITELSP